MPNPSIRGRGPFGEPIPPPEVEVLWMVYLLRHRGDKLDKDGSQRTGMLGVLTFWRTPEGELNARLENPAQDRVLRNLYQVRVMPNDPAGSGILLHGTEMATTAAGPRGDVPQGWWCMVHSAQPLRAASHSAGPTPY